MSSKILAAAFALAIGVAPVAVWAQSSGGSSGMTEEELLLQQELLLKKKRRQAGQEPGVQGGSSDVIDTVEPEQPRKRQRRAEPEIVDPGFAIVEPGPETNEPPRAYHPAPKVYEEPPRIKRKIVRREIDVIPGPSAVEIERRLEVRPRVRLAPEDRVTIREFKRRPDLRRAAPSIDIQAINFEFGSAEIPYSQYRKVENIAIAINRLLRRNPDTQILIEGHTDAVGSFASNQRLSELRAASLRRLLIREFGVPSYAMETVGYGEEYLLVPTQYEEWRNRRVTLRSIDDFIR